MAFLDDLAAGAFGLVAMPPPYFTLLEQSETSAAFRDDERGLGWWFFFFPDLHLDLDVRYRSLLERDVQRHTRLLFELMFVQGASGMKVLNDQRPRTDDLTWTPVIEIEHIEIDRAAALHVLHRMQYQPTRESIMGHTLVPLERGLFEARWYCMAQMTGLRESMLMLQLDGDLEQPRPPQSVFDDPAHDAAFPQHPLSIARAAKRWHADSSLAIRSSPRRKATSEVWLDGLDCSVVAPPRFILNASTTDHEGTTFVFARVSFAGTDGIDRLILTRTHERIRGIAVARRLARFAEQDSRRVCVESGLDKVTCKAARIEGDRPEVQVVTEGEPQHVGCGRARTVWRWFIDEHDQVWSIAIATTIAVTVDELAEEVAAVRSSLRRT